MDFLFDLLLVQLILLFKAMLLVSPVNLNILPVIFGIDIFTSKNLKYTLFFDKQCFSCSKLPGR